MFILTLIFAGIQEHPERFVEVTPVKYYLWPEEGTTFVVGTSAMLNIVYPFVGQVCYLSFIAEMKNQKKSNKFGDHNRSCCFCIGWLDHWCLCCGSLHHFPTFGYRTITTSLPFHLPFQPLFSLVLYISQYLLNFVYDIWKRFQKPEQPHMEVMCSLGRFKCFLLDNDLYYRRSYSTLQWLIVFDFIVIWLLFWVCILGCCLYLFEAE